MPKTYKDLLKRHTARAYINIDTAGDHLNAVREAFEQAHPDEAAALMVALQSLANAQEIIKAFTIVSWGKVPDSWESWSNDNKSTYDPPSSDITDEPTCTDVVPESPDQQVANG